MYIEEKIDFYEKKSPQKTQSYIATLFTIQVYVFHKYFYMTGNRNTKMINKYISLEKKKKVKDFVLEKQYYDSYWHIQITERNYK